MSAPSLDASAWAALGQLWFVLRSICFDLPGKASLRLMQGAKEAFCTFETRAAHLGASCRTLMQPYAIKAARDPTLFVLRKGASQGCMHCVSLAGCAERRWHLSLRVHQCFLHCDALAQSRARTMAKIGCAIPDFQT